jgi:hypothetical protein
MEDPEVLTASRLGLPLFSLQRINRVGNHHSLLSPPTSSNLSKECTVFVSLSIAFNASAVVPYDI